MRHGKQFLYALVYLVFWAAVGSGIYYHYVKPAPSCFDNIQNQNEEGVDCGGGCAKICTPSVATLTVGATNVFSLLAASSSPRGSLVAEVRNPNEGWAAASFGYTFTVSDANGAPLGQFSGISYIHAGEVKYISLPNVALTGSGAPASAALVLSEPAWRKPSEFPAPVLTLNVRATDTAPVVVARGTLTNGGAVPVTAELTALFYGANGVPLGVSATSLEHLNASETREFSIFHPALPGIDPSLTRIFASGYSTQ
jgi:hypothetical protein